MGKNLASSYNKFIPKRVANSEQCNKRVTVLLEGDCGIGVLEVRARGCGRRTLALGWAQDSSSKAVASWWPWSWLLFSSRCTDLVPFLSHRLLCCSFLSRSVCLLLLFSRTVFFVCVEANTLFPNLMPTWGWEDEALAVAPGSTPAWPDVLSRGTCVSLCCFPRTGCYTPVSKSLGAASSTTSLRHSADLHGLSSTNSHYKYCKNSLTCRCHF